MGADVTKFIARWESSSASEQQNKDGFLIELCELLEVPRPDPASGDPAKDRYVFEYPVRETDAQGQVHTKRIDLYKEAHFLLEAKQGADKGAKKAGTAKRGTNAWHIAMNDAYGQALGYARTLAKPVPILVVCDIGHCFDIYESFDGSGAYRHFPTAQTSRLYLRDLAKHTDTLRRIFTDPLSLDPSRKAAKVTREVAGYLANLAKNLEDQGHAQETVARFLMRCLFTMFAEDIELLPDHLFTRLLDEHWIPHPKSFPGGVQSLWETMNTGGDMLIARVRHFNGGLFTDTAALPLDEHALRLLHLAAKHDWSDVEPAIFGTLLERALDSKERHQLGAHYTPRAYVERLVRPTIEEPLRADWDVVRAEVAQLRIDEEKAKTETAKRKKRAEAIKRVRGFHHKLCGIRVLDPACGSGNFLYVALHLFQQIESEIWALLESLGESQDVLRLEGLRVTPAQFLGIEKKRWAKEIAELVLWIGYLQWHYRMLGKRPPVFDPVLHDYKNIENRDAILAYDAEELVTDEKGKPVTRWDGETTKIHPVTKKEVPDDSATVQIFRYANPRKAEWPQADFIISNPPFIGGWKIRQSLGDGYVEALWGTCPEIPEKADYVMYWWDRAAAAVGQGRARRFGLITTNSITQIFQRRVVARHLDGSPTRVKLVFAIPDHPWIDASDAAAVRVAMTVGESGTACTGMCALGTVIKETGEDQVEVRYRLVDQIGPELRAGSSPSAARALRANNGLCSPGVQLYGSGFIVTKADADRLMASTEPGRRSQVIRPYANGRDMMGANRASYVIDFFGMSEREASSSSPQAFQWILNRVKPERDQNRRTAIRENWWRFGWERPLWRAAVAKIRRFIVTPETSKHRVFMFMDSAFLPDNKLWGFALDDAFYLGVLSSSVHVKWALAAGGRLEDRPVYNKTTCLDPFPFADPAPKLRQRIADLAESLDAHRKARLTAHPQLTITGIYNVLDKLRSGAALTDKEAGSHEEGLISVLKKLHDDLDDAVFEAYGWPPDLTDEQILEKLVALNAERADEEKRGIVRWLRPDFQNPGGKPPAHQTTLTETDDAPDDAGEPSPAPAGARPWPKKMSEQITAVRDNLSAGAGLWTAPQVAAAFTGAKPADVIPVLESLASLGFLLAFGPEDAPCWKALPAR